MKNLTKIDTDILVIGGGIAGCFAAMEARKSGADVLLVDKGYVSSSGQSCFVMGFFLFDPEKDNKTLWLDSLRYHGDYLVNLDWAETILDMSKGCFEDLESFGVEFEHKENGELFLAGGDGPSDCRCAGLPGNFITLLRKAVEKSGVKILDRTMMAELLLEEGRVCGAVGMTVTDANPVAIMAKNVVIATGASALKPPSFPVSNLTGDGDMMAYRAGASVSGKEFIDCHSTTRKNPSYFTMNPLKRHSVPQSATKPVPKPMPKDAPNAGGPDTSPGPGKYVSATNGCGDTVIFPPHMNLGPEFEVHAGRGPIINKGPLGEVISCGASGMGGHKTEGIWAESLDASTAVPGLYAAGDSLSTMMTGAAYGALGLASCGSAVTGKIAGGSAAKDLATIATSVYSQEKIDAILAEIYAPMQRKGGFKPKWLITLLRNSMMPYYVMHIKHEERLSSVLSQVRFMKNHIVPKLYCDNDHELRLAIEAKNMVMNTEVKLLSALARTESRGTHYREDYPDRDEENMRAWFTVRQENGEAMVERVEMPDEWGWQEGEDRLVTFPKEF